MTFEQTRDVLNRAKQFHQELSAYFKQLGDSPQQEKVKLLLDYLSRHETNLANALERYSADASQGILETWYQYTPPPLLQRKAEELQLKDNMTLDEIVKKALEFDECLVSFYRSLAENSETQALREVFENLLAMENEERHRRTRSIQALQDM